MPSLSGSLLLAAALILCACETRASSTRPDPRPASPAPASSAAAARPAVPKGCEINLAGRYHLEKKPAWRYVVADDGIHLLAQLQTSADTGTKDAMTLALDRTAEGFVGMVVGNASTAGGVACPVAFKAAIIGCDPESVTLRSDDAVTLDEQCRMHAVEGSTTDKVLVRE